MIKLLVTGSDGRFAKILKKINSKYKFIFRNKKQLNVLSATSILNNFKGLNQNLCYILLGFQDQ